MSAVGQWLRTMWSRGRALANRDRVEREFDEELSTHLELLVDEERRNGLSPADARREAIRRLGRPEIIREIHREQRGVHMFDTLVQDLKYAVRMLRKTPVFSAIVTLSLALGIGANTALFSMVDNLMLRSVPARDADRLVQVQQVALAFGFKKPVNVFPATAFDHMRAHNQAFSEIVGFVRLDRPSVIVDGSVEASREAEEVSNNFFIDLGVTPSIGRAPLPNDAAVAVISHGWWQTRFAGNPKAIGQIVTVAGQPYEIVGVAPRQFHGLSLDYAPDLWVTSRSPAVMQMVARMKTGVTPAEAKTSTQVILQDLALVPKEFASETELVAAGNGLSRLRAQFARPLLALTTLVAVVLLITCTNVATLMMVRNTARGRERTVRVALGASRARLVALNLVESVMLAMAGGALALLFARWGVTLLLSMLPLTAIPPPLAFQVDARVLGFAVLVSILCALLFGLAPALRATKVDLASALRSSQGAASPKGVRHVGRLLMVFQVGLSVLLLVGAGLFLQTLRNLAHVDIGFNPNNLLQVAIDTRAAGYPRGQVGGVHQLMLERIGSIPGVQSVSSVRNPIMKGALSRGMLRIPGLTIASGDSWETADVGPAFFETTRIPLLRGRTFTAADFASPRGFVVTDAWARKYVPNDDPVAKGIGVLGIVGNVRLAGVRRETAPLVFMMTTQELDRLNSLLVRTSAEPTAVIPAIREALGAINPRLLVDVRTMNQDIAADIAIERMVAATSAFFGLLGVLLVSIGIFGVASYTVSQRTTELGIRMALGAGRWSVIRDSLRDTIRVFGVGLALGVVAAFFAVRLVASLISDLLFGLSPTDAFTIVLAVLLMALVAIAACILPARRATRIDPLTAIRCE